MFLVAALKVSRLHFPSENFQECGFPYAARMKSNEVSLRMKKMQTHHTQRDPTEGEGKEVRNRERKGRTMMAVTFPYRMAPQILFKIGVLSSTLAL